MTRGDHQPSLIFTGLRGVGKTVLLLECEALAREPDGRHTMSTR